MSFKTMSIKEFHESGILQELNRQFLHPLGLALYVKADDNGDVELGGIMVANDPEGFCFSGWITPKAKAYVKKLRLQRAKARKKLFGSIIQPIKPRSKYISRKMRLSR